MYEREKFKISTHAYATELTIHHGDGTEERNVSPERYREYLDKLEVRPSKITVEQTAIHESSNGNGRTGASIQHVDLGDVQMTRIRALAYVTGEGEASIDIGRTPQRITQIAADFATQKAEEEVRPSFLGRVVGKLLGPVVARLSTSDLANVDPRYERAVKHGRRVDEGLNRSAATIRARVEQQTPGVRVESSDRGWHDVEREVQARIREEIREKSQHLETVQYDNQLGVETRTLYANRMVMERDLLEQRWNQRDESVSGTIDDFAAHANIVTTVNDQVVDVSYWRGDTGGSESSGTNSSDNTPDRGDVPFGTIGFRW